MENNKAKKKTCIRFDVPGATIRYESKKYSEEFSPLGDMSRGGVKFFSKNPLDINADIILKISIPGERIPLTFHGKIRWISFIESKNQYQVGVQFNPYGEKEGHNYPGNLVKIISLEQKFAPKDKAKIEKYEIYS
jgi:Tfp pilus assembly protein PilZ